MPIRRYYKRNYHSVGIVIDSEDAEDQDISYCENCYKVGILNKLRERVYLDMSGKFLVNPPLMLKIGYNAGNVAILSQ
jgi:hypothetical protein